MPIHFIPNDPLASSLNQVRSQAPRPNRPAHLADLRLLANLPEALHQAGTPGFLHWQCREAALCAIETWENVAGALNGWARARPDRRLLLLEPDAGEDLNAYYDGQSLSFFHANGGGKTTFSGASTDVVAHEAGHAFLDAIRPDLWSDSRTETGAFHEAFGDCLAILTALEDGDTRQRLLQVAPRLDAVNFVEATAEDLSDGVLRRLGSAHPAAAPRHAFNDFLWQLPTTLPTSAPPARLTSEVHSFGRVFSGCFYDLIRFLFEAGGDPSADALLSAARTAGALLVAGTRQAPINDRFFQAVGRAMVLADAANGGAHRDAIRRAFERHGIALGSAAMLAPTAALEGKASLPARGERRGKMSSGAREDLRRRLGAAPGERVELRDAEIGSADVIEAIHRRTVDLGSVDPRLKGVVALAPESVLVGSVEGRAAVLGAIPDVSTTEDEVRHFAATLLENDQLSMEPRRATRRRAALADETYAPRPTHVVRTRGGQRVLERVAFVCAPGQCACR